MRKALVLAVAVAIVGAACGGSDDNAALSTEPSRTAALTGDSDATIDLTVWIPGIVLAPESVVSGPAPTDETPATDPNQVSEEVADCFMYLEMYPELLEIDPSLTGLCEVDVAAARTIISALLAELEAQ